MGADVVSQVQLYLPSQKLQVNARRSHPPTSPTAPPSPPTPPLPPSSQLLLCSSHAATRPHLSGPVGRPSLTMAAASLDSQTQLSIPTHGDRKRRKESTFPEEATDDDNSACTSEPNVAIYHGAWYVPAHAIGVSVRVCQRAAAPLPQCIGLPPLSLPKFCNNSHYWQVPRSLAQMDGIKRQAHCPFLLHLNSRAAIIRRRIRRHLIINKSHSNMCFSRKILSVVLVAVAQAKIIQIYDSFCRRELVDLALKRRFLAWRAAWKMRVSARS
jgi:hypothetical protein